MRLVFTILSLFSSSAFADGLARSQGLQVMTFRESTQNCQPDQMRSANFLSGRFPSLVVNSRIESVTDVSKNDSEIRLRLYGWVEEMTDYREADLLIRGSEDTLNKFKSDPNISNRYVRITTDSRCAKTAALVESVDVVYGWRQTDPSLVSGQPAPGEPLN